MSKEVITAGTVSNHVDLMSLVVSETVPSFRLGILSYRAISLSFFLTRGQSYDLELNAASIKYKKCPIQYLFSALTLHLI